MIITVLSCDKNQDLWEPFHHCMEKYFPGHPEVVYFTESLKNPYYRTISVPHDLNNWTYGVRHFLSLLEDNYILLMIDDCFIRRPVDRKRFEFANILIRWQQDVACLNFEKSWDEHDTSTEYEGWKLRPHGSEYEVSIMCGMWNKKKLMNVLTPISNPWDVEYNQNNCNYNYYINSGDYIIDWGYRTFQPCNVVKGKWAREIIPFFETEGIQMDYSIRGFA